MNLAVTIDEKEQSLLFLMNISNRVLYFGGVPIPQGDSVLIEEEDLLAIKSVMDFGDYLITEVQRVSKNDKDYGDTTFRLDELPSSIRDEIRKAITNIDRKEDRFISAWKGQ